MDRQHLNVLVIMLDSQRPDVLGCARNGPDELADDFAQIRTPHIDAVAASGIVFDRAYAEYPITVPSRTALVSGCYTFTNRPWCPLRSYDFNIVELLREHGYTTACWSDTPMNTGAALARGFDLFDEITVGKGRRQDEEIDVDLMGAAFPESGGEAEVQFWTNTLRGRHVARRDYGKTCPALLFDKAIQWLAGGPKQPFFAWVDTFDPHEPWCPEPPYDTMYPRPEGGRYIPMPHGPSVDWMSE
ncbi:MAG: sulfatase-like hydrolase/transferase, partial [Armatimonadota bacterium]